MPDGQVLEFTRVTKRFNDVTAVSDLSARVEPGVVTAFLGPNGAGKTTSLRILLGQVRATSGTATIGGVAYPELRHPLRTIGSVLEETAYRSRRSAARHLTIAAKANGIPLSRVDEVLSLVGLEHEAEGRVGSFSLGMRQRLSVAHALLGDPGALVFDEPANGLDPEGIRWMRLLMRRLADEGRTVLVSSHVLSEIEQVADHVLVLSKGQLVLSSGIETLADPSGGSVVVDSADRAALRAALSAAGFEVEVLRSGLRVRGGDAQTVGAIAASAGVALSTLVQRGPTLEDVFIELVRGGTLGPRAVAAASEYVAPQDPAPADAESDAGAVADDADAVVVPPIDAAAPGAPVDIEQPTETDAAADVDHAADAESSAGADTGSSAAPDAESPAGADAESLAEPDADRVHDATETRSDDTDASPSETDADGTGAAAATAASFDDILFGSGSAPEQSDEQASSESTDSSASDHVDADASGVEIFDDLSERGDDSEQGNESEDADPRSAAVTSMLASAARAYYDDEPADYPLGVSDSPASDADGEESAAQEPAGEGAGDDASEGEAAEGEAHWTVAGTGVIDQVPAWAPADDLRAEDEQHHDGEHHDGEHHDGEHRHD